MATYTPHIGEFYFKEKINKDSYFYLAGHHHCMRSNKKQKYNCYKENCSVKDKDKVCTYYTRKCPLYEDCEKLLTNPNYRKYFQIEDEYKKSIENKFDSDKCRKRIHLACETRFSINDYVTNHLDRTPNFIFKHIEEVRKKLEINIEKYEFYKYIAFANYVQEITTNKENDPEIIENKYFKNEDNRIGFKENYKLLKPDVIVVLHRFKNEENEFLDIKSIILDELCNINDPFIELVNLSEEGKYYILAKTSSKLYNHYISGGVISKYSNFITEARKIYNKKGKRLYKDEAIAGVIAYDLAQKGIKLERKKLCQILKENYRLFRAIDDVDNNLTNAVNEQYRNINRTNKNKELYNMLERLIE